MSGQSKPGSAAPSMPPRDKEGGLNSGRTASLSHQAGACGSSNASPVISCGAESSGSESSATASDLQPRFGVSFRRFGGPLLTIYEEEEVEEAEEEDRLQDPPNSPLPPNPKLKFHKKFFQKVRGILHLKGGGASGGVRGGIRPLNSNSLWGAGDRPKNWFQFKQLPQGTPLPETVGSVPEAAGPQGPGGAPGSALGRRTPETAVGEREVLPSLRQRQQHSPGLAPASRGAVPFPDRGGAGLRPRAEGGSLVPLSELGEPPRHPLDAFPWFHGTLPRLHAAQLVLSGGIRDHGLFLLRHSETQAQLYVLTLNCQGKAKHILVFPDEDGQCKVANLLFRSIFDMLDYFCVYPVPLKSERTCSVTLIAYVKASHCFSALPPSPPGWRRWCQYQAQLSARTMVRRCNDFVEYHLGGPKVPAVSRCLLSHFLEHFEAEVAQVIAEDGGGAFPNTIAVPLRSIYHPRVPLW